MWHHLVSHFGLYVRERKKRDNVFWWCLLKKSSSFLSLSCKTSSSFISIIEKNHDHIYLRRGEDIAKLKNSFSLSLTRLSCFCHLHHCASFSTRLHFFISFFLLSFSLSRLTPEGKKSWSHKHQMYRRFIAKNKVLLNFFLTRIHSDPSIHRRIAISITENKIPRFVALTLTRYDWESVVFYYGRGKYKCERGSHIYRRKKQKQLQEKVQYECFISQILQNLAVSWVIFNFFGKENCERETYLKLWRFKIGQLLQRGEIAWRWEKGQNHHRKSF